MDPSQDDDDENSLEGVATSTEVNSSGSTTDSNTPTTPAPAGDDKKEPDAPKPKDPKKGFAPLKFIGLGKKLDIYLLSFILLIIIAAIVIFVGIINNKEKNNNANTESLNQSTINQLNNNDTNVGGAQQTLEIQSNSVFESNVLIKGNLQVAGTTKLGGTLDLTGLSVTGASNLNEVNANALSVSGTAAVAGQLTIQQGLTDAGSATFNGNVSAPQITVTTLQLNGDIQIAHHITTNGSLPTSSATGALGGGGTTSISGSDTAGIVDINTGSSPSSGCFANINFASHYANSPHVVITPVQTGSSFGGSGTFYITHSSTGFSICSTSAPSGSFGVDYIVID